MYGKEITVGMKVRPVIKTIDGPLSASTEWQAAKEKKQDFLYVIGIEEKTIICAVTKSAKEGDQFSTIDLRSLDWAGWPSREPGFVHTPKNPVPATEPAKKGKGKKAKKEVKPAIEVDWDKNSN
jgi:hypothetical protein